MAYLLSGSGARTETEVRRKLPPYQEIYDASLAQEEDAEKAADSLRKQFARDVDALRRAGIGVEIEGSGERRYRLDATEAALLESGLTEEEGSVLAGAVRELSRDFPYSGPLKLALANLAGARDSGKDESAAFDAALSAMTDHEVSRRVERLEAAVSRRKRVRFEYYSISRDETSEREVEPYAISLIEGVWYVTGRDAVRDAVRQFRVSRMQGAARFSTKRPGGDYEVPSDFDSGSAAARAPWQLGEPEATARVRMSGDSLLPLRGMLPYAGTIEPGERGRVFVTPYSGERQLAAWVLSLGEDAEALSPETLVERVEQGLARIAEAHGGKPSSEET